MRRPVRQPIRRVLHSLASSVYFSSRMRSLGRRTEARLPSAHSRVARLLRTASVHAPDVQFLRSPADLDASSLRARHIEQMLTATLEQNEQRR